MSDRRSGKQTSAAHSARQDGSDPTTRQRLYAVAASLFKEQGYDRTRTRELSERLGIQSASLYYYIKNKEDLLYDICLAGIQDITAAVEMAAAGQEDPGARLQAVIDAHVITALSAPDVHATMLFELKSLSTRRRRAIVARRDEYEQLIENVVAQCQRAGVVRRDIPTRQLTLALLNLLNWTIFWFRPSGEFTPEEIARFLSLIFMEGASLTSGVERTSSRRA